MRPRVACRPGQPGTHTVTIPSRTVGPRPGCVCGIVNASAGSGAGWDVPGPAYRSAAMLSLRTQSFCRYRIHGEVPSPYGERFHERLKERRFLPLQGDEERAYGWVTADNLLVTEFHIGTVLHGEYAAFALRVDRRRVNARLLRAHLELDIQAQLKAAHDGGGRVRLGRDERREMREALRRDMLQRTSPSVDAYTVLLHPKKRLVHVLTLGRAANELVRLHFRDTFEADLQLLTPWQRSQELLEVAARDEGDDLRPALQDLRRTDFGRVTAPPRAPRASTRVEEARS